MPKDLVVVARFAREAKLIGDFAHAATYDHGQLYIWCFGDTTATLWASAPKDTPAMCLRCLAYGPRGAWVSDDSFNGARTREESYEGTRVILVDQETYGSRRS